jgi:homoserine kinase
VTATVTVRVSASTSNLGAGFDCVGVAVDRWLTVTATRSDDGGPPRLARRGTLVAIAGDARDDLIWLGVQAACKAARAAVPAGVALDASSEIPVGSGLGSSAAAVVDGAALATELLHLGLDRHDIASLCTAIEGHPDNVVPAVFGGAVLAIARPDEPLVTAALDVHESLTFVFAIPDFTLETKASRAVLPAALPHAVARAAAARSAALVRGLATGDGALLNLGLDDVLHVPYRRTLIRGYDAVVSAAIQGGAFGATLSGAGSGIVAIAPATMGDEVARAMAAAWHSHEVAALTFQTRRPATGYEIGTTSAPQVRSITGERLSNTGNPDCLPRARNS